MRTVDRAAPDVWHQRKEGLLAELKRTTGLEFILGKRPGSRIAHGPAGTLYLPAARERQPGRWWLGLNERVFFADERARGVVLLCETTTELFDFWLPADMVRALLPRLSPGPNDERKFNVVHRRDQFMLQVPKGEELDITSKRRDSSWLMSSPHVPARFPRPQDVLPAWQPSFLARVRKGRLEPLDPMTLEEGAVVVVRVSPAPTVPRQAALRRIVAAAGVTDLPADFAEQHDHYAHGAPRR